MASTINHAPTATFSPTCWSFSSDLHGWKRKFHDTDYFFSPKRTFSLPPASTFFCNLTLILQGACSNVSLMGLLPCRAFQRNHYCPSLETGTYSSETRGAQKTVSLHHPFPDAMNPNCHDICGGGQVLAKRLSLMLILHLSTLTHLQTSALPCQ